MPRTPEELFGALRKAPGHWATTRETFIGRIDTLLQLRLSDVALRAFWRRHVAVRGAAYIDLDLPIDDIWARTVADDALALWRAAGHNDDRLRDPVAPR